MQKPIHLYLCTAAIIASIIGTAWAKQTSAVRIQPHETISEVISYLGTAMEEPPSESIVRHIERAMESCIPTPATAKYRIWQFTNREAGNTDRLYLIDVDCQNLHGALVRSSWLCRYPLEAQWCGEPVFRSGVDPRR